MGELESRTNGNLNQKGISREKVQKRQSSRKAGFLKAQNIKRRKQKFTGEGKEQIITSGGSERMKRGDLHQGSTVPQKGNIHPAFVFSRKASKKMVS